MQALLAGVVFPDILRNSDLKKLRILRFQVPQTNLLGGQANLCFALGYPILQVQHIGFFLD